MKSGKVLNLYVNNLTFQLALSTVLENANNHKNIFFCFANAHMAVESLTNKELEEGLKKDNAVVFADGFPIVKSMKLIYHVNQERIAGMDFLPRILKECNSKKLSVLFFGSTKEILDGTCNRIKDELPDIKIAGAISPPFSKGMPDEEYVDEIINLEPDIVVVALGCPKQEIWMSRNYKKINAPLLGLGGALTVYSGMLSRAPHFVQQIGFEWLYRLLQEPGRLWKRYFYTNTVFIVQIIKQWTSIKLLKKKPD